MNPALQLARTCPLLDIQWGYTNVRLIRFDVSKWPHGYV